MKDYDDIINLPYKKSTLHPHMAMIDRAAQFSPFAALTGHKEATAETARLTDSRTELDDYFKEEINRRLCTIIEKKQRATVTYFLPDSQKDGGRYLTVSGTVKKYDNGRNSIKMDNDVTIPINDITNIEFNE
jgi:hypothetical protein